MLWRLLQRLVCDADYRLGRLGVEEIKAHPFFYGVNWETLRSEPSPYVPQLTSITDTSHFPIEELGGVPEAVDTSMQPGSYPHKGRSRSTSFLLIKIQSIKQTLSMHKKTLLSLATHSKDSTTLPERIFCKKMIKYTVTAIKFFPSERAYGCSCKRWHFLCGVSNPFPLTYAVQKCVDPTPQHTSAYTGHSCWATATSVDNHSGCGRGSCCCCCCYRCRRWKEG